MMKIQRRHDAAGHDQRRHYQLLAISCMVGFFGDIGLQILTVLGMGGKTGWGLHEYFRQHGRLEAPFLAAGMMTLFYVLYLWFKLPINYLSLALYGIILDLIFRFGRVFPSLAGYYKALNLLESGIWGAIPLTMPLFVYQIFV